MSHKKIIAENSPIFQYLLKLNFTLYFTIPVLRHIVEFVSASVQKGYNGTVKDIVTLSLTNCHRTTYGSDPQFILASYILKNPSYIFANPSEQAVITLDNDYILLNHLRCAAEELPLEEKDEEWFGAGYIDAVKALIKEGSLYLVNDYAGMRRETFRQGKKYAYTGKSAAHKFNLSSFENGNVKLIHDGEVLEVLSRRQAIMEAHPGAIYLHQAKPYRVKEFDLDDGVVTVEPAEKNLNNGAGRNIRRPGGRLACRRTCLNRRYPFTRHVCPLGCRWRFYY